MNSIKSQPKNCYNIVAYGDTANGTFNFINSASEPIEGAGCGFSGNFYKKKGRIPKTGFSPQEGNEKG
jgi:hypothetical protein